MSVNYSTNV